MYFDEALRIFVAGLFAILFILFIRHLIINQRRVPPYTLAEAHRVAQASRTDALIMLAVIPVGDAIAWLISEHTGPLSTFVIILCVGDGLCFLKVLHGLQKMYLAKKRIREIELHQQVQSGYKGEQYQHNDVSESVRKVEQTMARTSTAIQLPPPIRSRLADYHLGTPLRVHNWAKQRIPVSFLLFFALVCGIIGLFFENAGLLLLAAVALLVLSSLQFYVAWRARNHQIVICTDGLLFMSRGVSDTAARWDEIEGVYISTHPLTYTILCKNKTTIKLQAGTWEWTQSVHLFATLEREIIRRFLPDAVVQFEQGNPVFFGDICVGKEGLSGWFGTIPWSEIKGVYMHQAQLVVLKTAHRHQRLQFSAETSNPFVLIALVRHILNARQAES